MSEEQAKTKRRRKRRRTVIGETPGTLKVDPHAPQPIISVIAYGPDEVAEKQIDGPNEISGLLGKHPVIWVNVDGLGNADTIRLIGEIFSLHRLALEDVVSVHQRAKVEPYGEQLFMVARMLSATEALDTEQLSMFLGKDFVLTFQETHGDYFDPVRERIRKKKGRIRGAGADYLAYALLDAIVDSYFPIVERYGETMVALEDVVFAQPDSSTAARLHQSKRDLILLRRAIWPLREALASLFRDEYPLVSADTRLYLRDCYDHAIQVMEMVDGQRETAADLMNLYLTCVSNRMNEVMKVLTVIATIFIPLTFVAGIYGMNFDPDKSPWNMPELRWAWGYPACLAVMVIVTVVMLVFFRRRGWLGGGDSTTKIESGAEKPGQDKT